jgi:hypothetical protein
MQNQLQEGIAAALIGEQITRLEGVRHLDWKNPQFVGWHDTTMMLLQRFLPPDSPHLNTFRSLEFRPRVAVRRLPYRYRGPRPTKGISLEDRVRFERDCATALECIKAALEEIQTFGVHAERKRHVESQIEIAEMEQCTPLLRSVMEPRRGEDMTMNRDSGATTPPPSLITDTPAALFYSYSHKDETLRDELDTHLSPLRREGIIRPWHDRRIGPGKDLEHEINSHLEDANVILLLVSPDFVASDYCYSKEVARALERHQAGEVRVVPVILRPVDWKKLPLGKLLALPKDGYPVTKWQNRDEAFLDVAQGIRHTVAELRQQASAPLHSIRVQIIDAFYSRDYNGIGVVAEIHNNDNLDDQVVDLVLDLPECEIKLVANPGGATFSANEPWLPRTPFDLTRRKMKRGSVFFKTPESWRKSTASGLQEALPMEPLRGSLAVQLFSAGRIECPVEIYSISTNRARAGMSPI